MIYERFAPERRDLPFVYYSEIDKDLEPGVRYGPVIRNVYIVELCTGGYGSVVINDTEFPISSGDCYFLLPGDTVTHTADTVKPREGYWAVFDGIDIGSILKRAGVTSTSPFVPKNCYAPIKEQLKLLYSMKNDSDKGADYP